MTAARKEDLMRLGPSSRHSIFILFPSFFSNQKVKRPTRDEREGGDAGGKSAAAAAARVCEKKTIGANPKKN